MFFKPLEKLKSPFWSCYCVSRDVLTTVMKDVDRVDSEGVFLMNFMLLRAGFTESISEGGLCFRMKTVPRSYLG